MSVDVSGILGEYMLKGWVLTDRTCPNNVCITPLMRSPNGRIPIVHFCAKCDPKPESQVQRPSLQLFSSVPTSAASTVTSSDSLTSGTSTPPTELSSSLSSPTFALPPETAESRRRREQSDSASAEIGKRLLKGWTMLAEECPNTQCFGVPLVRSPRTEAATDPKSECVICGTRFVINTDWSGRHTLVPVVLEPIGSPTNSLLSHTPARLPMNSTPLPVTLKVSELPSSAIPAHETSTWSTTHQQDEEPNSLMSTLNSTMLSLERALQSLAARMSTLVDGHLPIDASAIGSTADAIAKTTQALSQVKQLHWNEMQSQ